MEGAALPLGVLMVKVLSLLVSHHSMIEMVKIKNQTNNNLYFLQELLGAVGVVVTNSVP